MNEHAPQGEFQQVQKKSGGGCARCAIGCGIFVILLTVAVVVACWLFWRPVVAWAISFGTNQAVEASGMPEDQKQAIISRVDQFADDFADGNITLEDFAEAMEDFDPMELVTAGMTQFIGSAMIDSSQLSDDQKAEGKQALYRVTQGIFDGQISQSEIENALAPMLQNPGSGDWEFKQNPTPQELQQAVDNANDLADQKGIPENVDEVDFAAKVNEMLGIEQDQPEQTP